MSKHGRHRAAKQPRFVLGKVPAIAMSATLALSGAVAIGTHQSSAVSNLPQVPAVDRAVQQTLANTGSSASTQSATTQSVKAASVTATRVEHAAQKPAPKKSSKATTKSAKTQASVSSYLKQRIKAKQQAATRSRTIRNLRGQIASIKSQIRKPALVGKKVIAVADNYRGVPYVRGGTSPRGFDCSGYTQYVYRQIGINLPRVADAQANASIPIRRIYAKPGDLVFYRNSSGYVYHVAIYAGGNTVWHSPSPGKSVTKARIWSRNVTFGRVSKSKTQTALAITLAKKTAVLANLIHNK